MPEITYVSPQIGTTDYLEYDEDTTFEDQINQLKEKYLRDILEFIQQFRNVGQKIRLDQITVKLHYIDQSGFKQTIGLKTFVKSLTERHVDKVFWEPEPLGGKLRFFYTFTNGNWELSTFQFFF